MVTRFSKLVGTDCDHDLINERITQIETLEALTVDDKIFLNNIDKDLTRILTTADQKCHRFKDYPWSPQLDQAHLEHRYWTLRLSELKTKQSYKAAYEKIRLRLQNFDHDPQPPDTVSRKQRQARQNIRQIRREAQTKRKEFLNTLLQAAKATKNNAQKQLILGLKQAEENR